MLERALVPQLIENGYQVATLARNAEHAAALCGLGGEVSIADPCDRDGLTQAIAAAAPHVIIDLLTEPARLPGLIPSEAPEALSASRGLDVFDNLVAAARMAGVRRFIAQSFCGWPLTLASGALGKEEDPPYPKPPARFRHVLTAVRDREERLLNTRDMQALILRYGLLYGPGTPISRDGAIAALLRNRKLPLVRNASGVASFIHIADAARATVVAASQGAPGIYNIVDSEPAPLSQWLPLLAHALGAPAPRVLPAWLARFVIDNASISLMMESRGASNRKAISGLGWQPMFANYRQGFLKGL